MLILKYLCPFWKYKKLCFRRREISAWSVTDEKFSLCLTKRDQSMMIHAQSPRTNRNIFGKQWKNRLNRGKKNKNSLLKTEWRKTSRECLIYFPFQPFGVIFEICEAIWSQTFCDNLIAFRPRLAHTLRSSQLVIGFAPPPPLVP